MRKSFSYSSLHQKTTGSYDEEGESEEDESTTYTGTSNDEGKQEG